MKKSAPLAFRIPDDLKKGLEQIAHREARNVSQICQILLTIGMEAYNKEGSKYLKQIAAVAKRARVTKPVSSRCSLSTRFRTQQRFY